MFTVRYFYVYVLKSEVKNFVYVGYTENYKDRLNRHNKGYVQSTKSYKPYILIFLEVYVNKIDAKRRERYLKTTKGRTTLRSMLLKTLQE